MGRGASGSSSSPRRAPVCGPVPAWRVCSGRPQTKPRAPGYAHPDFFPRDFAQSVVYHPGDLIEGGHRHGRPISIAPPKIKAAQIGRLFLYFTTMLHQKSRMRGDGDDFGVEFQRHIALGITATYRFPVLDSFQTGLEHLIFPLGMMLRRSSSSWRSASSCCWASWMACSAAEIRVANSNWRWVNTSMV